MGTMPHPSPEALAQSLAASIHARSDLLARLHREGTDSYRLLHGATEGWPGFTVDRYGPLLWVQSFREPLPAGSLEALAATAQQALGVALIPVWNHRARGAGPAGSYEDAPEALGPHIAREGGLAFEIRTRPWGKDPWLFLDFRATRRWVRAHAQGCAVLNLFAYTCGVGVAAQAGGASAVCNVDFAASSLAVGHRNITHSALDPSGFETVQADVIPTIRQFAGLPVKGRAARKRRYPRFQPRSFDLVVLDPPTWATSPFGAIDPVRDYGSLLKPSLLATRPGGTIVATNHVSTVAVEDWIAAVERTAAKAGRPVQALELLPPDPDFPSQDGRHPLKVAIIQA
jgi:23S rRNA (cytosine1962-C5)-methyltransferase